MKVTTALLLAAGLALASTTAGAQSYRHPGSRDGRLQSHAVALPQSLSAAEQASFRRASRSWSGGGY